MSGKVSLKENLRMFGAVFVAGSLIHGSTWDVKDGKRFKGRT